MADRFANVPKSPDDLFGFLSFVLGPGRTGVQASRAGKKILNPGNLDPIGTGRFERNLLDDRSAPVSFTDLWLKNMYGRDIPYSDTEAEQLPAPKRSNALAKKAFKRAAEKSATYYTDDEDIANAHPAYVASKFVQDWASELPPAKAASWLFPGMSNLVGGFVLDEDKPSLRDFGRAATELPGPTEVGVVGKAVAGSPAVKAATAAAGKAISPTVLGGLEAAASAVQPYLPGAAGAAGAGTAARMILDDFADEASERSLRESTNYRPQPLRDPMQRGSVTPFAPLERAPEAAPAAPQRALGEVVGQQGTVAPTQLGTTRFRGGRERRPMYPGTYGNPNEMVDAVRVAPESINLPRLFGTTRSELSQAALARDSAPGGWTDAADARSRDLWLPPGTPPKPKGALAAQRIMTPSNERRLGNLWEAARTRRPELYEGMTGWYQMDPAYQRLTELVGPEEALNRYTQLNTLSGMASPGSDVLTEINRGSRANWLATEGNFPDFLAHGGAPGERFSVGGVPMRGHPYHSTAQAAPMQKYLDTGTIQSKEPKVPSYVQASMPTEHGFQGHVPVGDAHWARLVGLPDVRTSTTGLGKSGSASEMMTLGPWYDRLARDAGMTAVPGQALHWGIGGPQTGVSTPVGAPKLELIADKIDETARALGLPPEQVRDEFLLGRRGIGNADIRLLAAMGLGSTGALGAGYFASERE